jgi:hypothetical protein
MDDAQMCTAEKLWLCSAEAFEKVDASVAHFISSHHSNPTTFMIILCTEKRLSKFTLRPPGMILPGFNTMLQEATPATRFDFCCFSLELATKILRVQSQLFPSLQTQTTPRVRTCGVLPMRVTGSDNQPSRKDPEPTSGRGDV